VVRHAQATQVNIRLHTHDNALQLTIQDNGRGCAPEMLTGSKALGLLGMRERVTTVGGYVKLLSNPGQGTTVHVHAPYPTPRTQPQPPAPQ
jgi:signal transduction histidine kinase